MRLDELWRQSKIIQKVIKEKREVFLVDTSKSIVLNLSFSPNYHKIQMNQVKLHKCWHAKWLLIPTVTNNWI